jgi:hypothetical protein
VKASHCGEGFMVEEFFFAVPPAPMPTGKNDGTKQTFTYHAMEM